MLKSGSGAIQQEPYNEVIASIICDRLGIEDEIKKLTKGSVFVEESRVNMLCKGIMDRIESLTDLILSHTHTDDISADVAENIAYCGKDIERAVNEENI